MRLRGEISVWDIKYICNTDEVGILYGSFQIRSINPRDRPTGHKSVKYRLTSVLTAFSYVTNGPLVLIGPSAMKSIFMRRFDSQLDFGIIYYSQRNSCNTKMHGVLNWDI